MAIPLTRQAKGRWAENRVAWHYRLRGWRLVARNWYGGGGELDVVLSRWRTLLVVEVRHRAQGDAVTTIDQEKMQRTMRAAKALVRSFHLARYHLRIDLAAVDTRGRITVRREVQDLPQ